MIESPRILIAREVMMINDQESLHHICKYVAKPILTQYLFQGLEKTFKILINKIYIFVYLD